MIGMSKLMVFYLTLIILWVPRVVVQNCYR
jgi:hypothetical protein